MGFTQATVSTPLELSDAAESLLHTQPNVRLFMSADDSLGSGTLHITSKRVLWLPDSAQPAGSGYSIDFPQLLMHALSRDTAYFPHPAIYCQLEQDDDEDDGVDDADDGEEAPSAEADEEMMEGDKLTRAAEVRLVPEDEAARQLKQQQQPSSAVELCHPCDAHYSSPLNRLSHVLCSSGHAVREAE